MVSLTTILEIKFGSDANGKINYEYFRYCVGCSCQPLVVSAFDFGEIINFVY